MQNDDLEWSIEHVTVDPNEAGWDPAMLYRPEFQYKMFFRKSPHDFVNAMTLTDLRYMLAEQCGEEDKDWVVEQCSDYSKGDDERYGNAVYLTSVTWMLMMKLNGTMTEQVDYLRNTSEHFWKGATVVETRAG